MGKQTEMIQSAQRRRLEGTSAVQNSTETLADQCVPEVQKNTQRGGKWVSRNRSRKSQEIRAEMMITKKLT